MTKPVATALTADVLPDRVAERLGVIDWNFPRNSSSGIHALHPYPAKFIPDIPRTLIRELGVPCGTAVLDPFCGCGTTLVEAQSAGFKSIGIDVNPIACLVSRVKTTAMPFGLVQYAEQCVTNAQRNPVPSTPSIPNLDHWFAKPSQHAIAAILAQINGLESAELKDHLRFALSSILVRISNQESDTRYAAIRKNVDADLVYSSFVIACRRIANAKSSLGFAPSSAHIVEQDILRVTEAAIRWPIGLVVTSPPYPNAYEYWLYHKYRMWWLGYDPLSVKAKEIGARAHYFRRNHPTVADFSNQMRLVLSLLWRVVVSGGYVCIIVGRSRIHGRDIDNGAIFRDLASQIGFGLVTSISRTIAINRKSFNLSHARIKTEELVILRKD